ncbi:hypothetical protein L917_13456, partial [Phytophthora nicotianae]
VDAMMLATVKDLPVYSIVAKPSSEEVAVPEVLIPTKVCSSAIVNGMASARSCPAQNNIVVRYNFATVRYNF